MPKQYQYSDFFNQNVLDGMKKLHDMMISTDKVIKNIKTSPGTGEGLKTMNTEFKKTEGYFKSLISLQKQREKQDKTQAKQAEKFNIMLQQRKAHENALANEIKRRAREEAVLKRELKEIVVLQAKEIKSDKELIRLNTLLIRKRANMVVKTRQERKEYNQLTKSIARNEIQIRKTDKSIGRFQRNVGNYASSFRGMLGTLGLAGGAFMLVRAIKQMGNIFKSFEKDLSKLQAIVGVEKNIKALEIQAKKLGATTVFTARQILGLQTELAKLGFTVPQIVDATEGIQGLAAATGADLSAAATLAGSTLKIFDLAMSESTRVADVLALSTSKTALDMEKLAIALPIVGTSAKIAGKDLEWTVSRLGMLVDRGIQASTAGTALRKIFAELAKKGISYADAMDKINNSTDKAKTAIDLFGIRAKDAAIILAENTEAANDLELAFDNAAGAAQDMADVMLDNLAGDITLAQSAWEGFVLSIEDGDGVISTAIRSIVKGFTKLLGLLTEIDKRGSLGQSALANSDAYKKEAKVFKESIESQIAVFNKKISVQGEWESRLLTEKEKQLRIQEFFKRMITATNKEFKEFNELSKTDWKWSGERLKAQIKLEILNEKYKEFVGKLTSEINVNTNALDDNTDATDDNTKAKQKQISERTFREGMGLEGSKFDISRVILGGDIGEAKTILNEDIKDLIETAEITTKTELSGFQKFITRMRFGKGGFFARLFGTTDEDIEQLKQVVSDLFNSVMDSISRLLDARISAIDEILSKQDEEIAKTEDLLSAELNSIKELKAAGAAFSLNEKQRLEKKLADEQAARQQTLQAERSLHRKQQNLQIAQAHMDTASGIMNIWRGGNWILNLIQSAALAAIGVINIASIKSQKFAQGTRYLELGENQPGRDTIPAITRKGKHLRLDEGERILSRKTNAKIDRNFDNELIPDAIQFYQDGISGTPIMNLHDYSHDYSYIKEVAENTRSMGRVYNKDGKLIREQKDNVITFY